MSDDTVLNLNLPPLAKGTSIVGAAKDFAEDPFRFYETFIPKYGDLFRIKSIFFVLRPEFDHMVIVSNPDMVKHVMLDNNRNYVKSSAYKSLKLLLGEGLLTSEGDFWRKQRKLMQPGFHRDRLASFVKTYADVTQEMIQRWSELGDGAEVDVSEDFMQTTLDVVCRAMFSTDVGDAIEVVNREFDYANEKLIERIKAPIPIPLWFPLPHIKREKNSYEAIKNVVADIIEKRRKSNEHYDDLLAMLMEVEDADTGEKMSNQQIQDEVITIFLAGHETTAVALSWLVHCLDENPEVVDKILEEEKSVLNGSVPTMENLRSLEYTRMVIDETLRLYPPVWVIGRHSLEHDTIGGYDIPKNTNLLIPLYYIHRDPKLWNDPEKFIPERFNKENSKGRHKFVYFPFGGGPRLCIGNNFALMEMQVIVPMIVRAFKMAKPKGFTFKKEPLITMRPNPHMKMVLTKRQQS